MAASSSLVEFSCIRFLLFQPSLTIEPRNENVIQSRPISLASAGNLELLSRGFNVIM